MSDKDLFRMLNKLQKSINEMKKDMNEIKNDTKILKMPLIDINFEMKELLKDSLDTLEITKDYFIDLEDLADKQKETDKYAEKFKAIEDWITSTTESLGIVIKTLGLEDEGSENETPYFL